MTLSKAFRLCTPLKNMDDVEVLMSWLEDTWFNLAMGISMVFHGVECGPWVKCDFGLKITLSVKHFEVLNTTFILKLDFPSSSL